MFLFCFSPIVFIYTLNWMMIAPWIVVFFSNLMEERAPMWCFFHFICNLCCTQTLFFCFFSFFCCDFFLLMLKPLMKEGWQYRCWLGGLTLFYTGEIGLKGGGDNMQLKLFGYFLGYKKCKILKALWQTGCFKKPCSIFQDLNSFLSAAFSWGHLTARHLNESLTSSFFINKHYHKREGLF